MDIVVGAKLTDFDLSGADISFLPPAEIDLVQRCLSPAEKKRRIAGRLVLKKTLARFFNITGPIFCRDAYDRPFLDNAHAPDFNFSHSGDMVLAGFSTTGRVGVDIELTARPSLKVIRRCLHEQELAVLKGLSGNDLQQRLADLWTCKEAYSKALGLGMRLSFAKFAFCFPGDAPPELFIPVSEDNNKWIFTSLSIGQYRATVCLPQSAEPQFCTLTCDGAEDKWVEGVQLP